MGTDLGSGEQALGGIRQRLAFIPDGRTIPDEVWETRHKYFVLLVLGHVPFLVVLGLFEGTETTVTGITLPSIPLGMLLLQNGVIAAFALAAAVPRLNRRLRTVLAVTGLAFTSGTLVYVTGGYIEAHFHFFVAIGIAAIYEDWLPFGIGIAYVVLTHGIFGTIDPSRVYNHTAAQMHPWVWGLIHGAFVAMLAAALTVHLSSIEQSRRNAQHELERARERATEIENLEKRQAEIEEEKQEAQRLKAEAERERAEVEELNDHLQTKAEAYQHAMEQVAAGDLTVRVDSESDSDAMVGIGETFNGMVGDIETTIAQIQSFAEVVQEQTDAADTSTRQAAAASDSVSTSVQEMATATEDQRQMLDEVAGEMSDLSATVEEVAASAQEVTQVSAETTEIATDGQALADDMIADAEQVQASIETAAETVAELRHRWTRSRR
ncbi:methyl-accepting chemotaxis protein [Halomicroarcula sp. GCM10025709]|uniref:methyl-accepting chemotaxis protein n=1 Tax=Halomicroarcula sp. GCM10025709 TaxID=3252669 RepID=UPI0036120727